MWKRRILKKIILLIKEKDPLGFELLYQRYFRFLFGVAYSVLNNEEDSYDVIQSVMLRLYTLDEKLFGAVGGYRHPRTSRANAV